MKEGLNCRIVFGGFVTALVIAAGCQTSKPAGEAAMYLPARTKESQAAMSPQDALAELRAGNARFVAGRSQVRNLPAKVRATALGAVNDNAAITYLATLVPGLSDPLKYAVVAAALAGGGLTVIANAPNPAGQSILSRYFSDGIAPLGLLLGALPSTVTMILCFRCAR